MPWSREFSAPIALKDGRSITTLGQGRALMLNLPMRNQVRPYWQYTAELLLIASQDADALDRARAQLSRALMIEGLL
jgi:predicted secreted protein